MGAFTRILQAAAPALPQAGQLRVRLHLGAHKTASTHLQNGLEGAREQLAAAGIGYLGPAEIRAGQAGLQTLLRDGNLGRAQRRFGRAIADCHTLIVSEENLLGTMEENFLGTDPGRGIYRRAALRIERLIAGFGLAEVELYLGLRDPAEYYLSCYRYHIQRRPFLTWTAYSSAHSLREVSWARLVRDLRAVPGVATVTFWRHEDYPDVSGKVLDALLGPGRPQIALAAARANPGLSGAEVRAQYDAADAPLDFGGEGFRPFGRAALARASRRYRREVRQMARMPGVRLLRP